MKTLSKQIEELVKSSKTIRRPKQALEALFQIAFNNLTNPKLWERAFPRGYMSLNPHYAKSPTDLSVSDQEQLVEMFKTWLSLIAENEPFFDVMSSQYDQYLGEDLGQFFTPWDVSQLLGALQVAQERTPNSIHDCCVGGGSLILGQLHALYHSQGKEAIQNLYLELQDIDPHMVKLASAQVVLSSIVHQIPLSHIKVIGGNVLTRLNEEVALYAIYDCPSYMKNNELSNQDKLEYRKLKNKNKDFFQVPA